MEEKLLHFIWKFRLFNTAGLKTTAGEKVEIVSPGLHNPDAGADFSNAKIRIGGVLWAGNVEIHIKSSDWHLHKHHKNEAYNNLVLHVVYQQDKQNMAGPDGKAIPVLELKDAINTAAIERYAELSRRKAGIPCKAFLNDVSEVVINNQLDRMLIERLETKVTYLQQLLSENGNDWEQLTFRLLARYMGAGVNKEPFEMLAASLPLKVWGKHAGDLLQLEAMLFGQAGLLNADFDDEYPKSLKREYTYLKKLYGLKPLQAHLFKFLRLRPSNFPTLRLAQLAALMNKETKLFRSLTDTRTVKDLYKVLEVEPSGYWQHHYLFDKKSRNVKAGLGQSMKDVLIINAIAPLLFAYGKYKADDALCDRAISLLEGLRAEDNSIVKSWVALGLKPGNAAQSQALLQLKNEHCDKFLCLQCSVGHKVLAEKI